MPRRLILFLLTIFFALRCVSAERPKPAVVDLTAPDGTKLKATYFAAAKPGPGIMLFHQCNRQRKMWDDLAPQLAAAGLNVLTLDFRGFGESGGTPFDKLTPQENQKMVTQTWLGDVDVAYQYLVSQKGVKREVIGAGGASCGVNQAVQLAIRHPEVKSLVLLSGSTNLAGRQFLRRSPQLPLFGAAADDDNGAVDLMQLLLSVSSNPGTQFQHYQTGGHGIEMFPPHKELAGLIVNWFDTSLLKTPGRAPKIASATHPAADGVLAMLDEPGGAAKASKALAEARQRDPSATLFSEQVVNFMGYEHIQSGDTKGAIEILKLNNEASPNSPNTYDSLSDAYLADGQTELAALNARKTIDMLATDTTNPEERRKLIRESAEQKLKQLQADKK